MRLTEILERKLGSASSSRGGAITISLKTTRDLLAVLRYPGIAGMLRRIEEITDKEIQP